ncbi:MAG: metalloregulator ArsR/SmtB family transcription factor [Desulfoplanes sp.]|nr:metalloregulator ArsR/SmtB family transcription factor [Desulfoplanes sp.]MDD4648501.1 metalloregulator ArsR/SmtB family transcription factor [Desulfoplanes sp.]
MKHLVKVMKALADPTRIKMLKMLEQRELCVCEIHASLHLAQPTISKHLKILEEAGLVDKRKEAQFVIYFLESSLVNSHLKSILRGVSAWAGETREMAELLDKLSGIDRNEIIKQRRKQ